MRLNCKVHHLKLHHTAFRQPLKEPFYLHLDSELSINMIYVIWKWLNTLLSLSGISHFNSKINRPYFDNYYSNISYIKTEQGLSRYMAARPLFSNMANNQILWQFLPWSILGSYQNPFENVFCHVVTGTLLIWPLGTIFSEILIKIQYFHSQKCIWKCLVRNGGHIFQGKWVKINSYWTSHADNWISHVGNVISFCYCASRKILLRQVSVSELISASRLFSPGISLYVLYAF